MDEFQQVSFAQMMTEESLGPVKSLQSNASQFFERVQKNFSGALNCKKGCSACCYVTLSVFESEAVRILEWALGLPENEREALKSKLLHEPAAGLGPDATGKSRPACAALRNNSCTIYEARPVICRTQGAPVQWKTADTKINRDHCPLNFKNENDLPPLAECLDLDRLTALQSIAQRHWSRSTKVNADRSLGDPENFLWSVSPEGRVALNDVVRVLCEVI